MFRAARTNVSPEVQRRRICALADAAEAHRHQGRYEKAESLLRRALTLAPAAFGGDDLAVASLLNNLAVVHKYQGRFTEAGRLYRRALRITVRALGPEHPDVAAVYHNLGGLEHARGRYAKGEPFARRSVAIREKALGADHPDVAADRAALAALLDGQGKYDEAERLCRRALAVFERVFGPEHYEVAVNLNNLAALRQSRGDAAGAERLARRAPGAQGEAPRPGPPGHGPDPEQPGGAVQVAAEVCGGGRAVPAGAGRLRAEAGQAAPQHCRLPGQPRPPAPGHDPAARALTRQAFCPFHPLTEGRFPMKPRKPEQAKAKQIEPRKEVKKAPFRIVKLEERIAPALTVNHNETLLREAAESDRKAPQPRGRQRPRRFRIDKLEERIAPKGNPHGTTDPCADLRVGAECSHYN